MVIFAFVVGMHLHVTVVFLFRPQAIISIRKLVSSFFVEDFVILIKKADSNILRVELNFQ